MMVGGIRWVFTFRYTRVYGERKLKCIYSSSLHAETKTIIKARKIITQETDEENHFLAISSHRMSWHFKRKSI